MYNRSTKCPSTTKVGAQRLNIPLSSPLPFRRLESSGLSPLSLVKGDIESLEGDFKWKGRRGGVWGTEDESAGEGEKEEGACVAGGVAGNDMLPVCDLGGMLRACEVEDDMLPRTAGASLSMMNPFRLEASLSEDEGAVEGRRRWRRRGETGGCELCSPPLMWEASWLTRRKASSSTRKHWEHSSLIAISPSSWVDVCGRDCT